MNELEKKYGKQFKAVFDAIRELMTPPVVTRRRIGFQRDESPSPKHTKRLSTTGKKGAPKTKRYCGGRDQDDGRNSRPVNIDRIHHT